MSEKKRTKRAPRGYRIVLWADGFYHVYHGGNCIDETLSRFAGIFSAKQHAAQQGELQMDLLALIEKLEKEYPCVGDHETDARDTYPNRWQALKETVQQGVQWALLESGEKVSTCPTCAHVQKYGLPETQSH